MGRRPPSSTPRTAGSPKHPLHTRYVETCPNVPALRRSLTIEFGLRRSDYAQSDAGFTVRLQVVTTDGGVGGLEGLAGVRQHLLGDADEQAVDHDQLCDPAG